MSNDVDTKRSVRANFIVSEDQLDRLREIAEAEHRTISGELRRLVEQRIAEADEEAA